MQNKTINQSLASRENSGTPSKQRAGALRLSAPLQRVGPTYFPIISRGPRARNGHQRAEMAGCGADIMSGTYPAPPLKSSVRYSYQCVFMSFCPWAVNGSPEGHSCPQLALRYSLTAILRIKSFMDYERVDGSDHWCGKVEEAKAKLHMCRLHV
ncbi:hypothetical protein AVEN_171034-1 [Araneus ventricosus]|uniref:Uncharacterized protein n=1 Tax=Araneus ventricosus TaxID=182803 RepID=A0A4Y2WX40_ARAVE|nr:hypothetical protein AVEN_171034-1 [Araneus ventricosus]